MRPVGSLGSPGFPASSTSAVSPFASIIIRVGFSSPRATVRTRPLSKSNSDMRFPSAIRAFALSSVIISELGELSMGISAISPTIGPGIGPTSTGEGISSGGLDVASVTNIKIMRGVPLDVFPIPSSAKNVNVDVPFGSEERVSDQSPSIFVVVVALVVSSRMIRSGSALPWNVTVEVLNTRKSVCGSKIIGARINGEVVASVVVAVFSSGRFVESVTFSSTTGVSFGGGPPPPPTRAFGPARPGKGKSAPRGS